MEHKYRHFFELRKNVGNKLNGRGDIRDRLVNAIAEIVHMREDETPNYAWKTVCLILERCKKHEPKGDEGMIRASIDKMNGTELKALQAEVESL